MLGLINTLSVIISIALEMERENNLVGARF